MANALSTIDEVLKSINEEQTKLGAVENRLESALEQIGVAYDNLVSTQSIHSRCRYCRREQRLYKKPDFTAGCHHAYGYSKPNTSYSITVVVSLLYVQQ